MSLWPCYVCIIKNNDFFGGFFTAWNLENQSQKLKPKVNFFGHPVHISELREEIEKVEVASALYFDFTFL